MRPPGGRRPRVGDAQPGLSEALDRLVETEIRGDPMCPLRWTTKSTRRLAAVLTAQGFTVSHVTVMGLLHQMGYSLQATAKENGEPTTGFIADQSSDLIVTGRDGDGIREGERNDRSKASAISQ